MIKLHLTAILLFVSQITFAQVTISGKITDHIQKPLSYATIGLLQNNSRINNAVSDSNGNYRFRNIKAGIYTLAYKFVAYRDTFFKVLIHADTSINVQLKPAQMLSEVVIKAKKV